MHCTAYCRKQNKTNEVSMRYCSALCDSSRMYGDRGSVALLIRVQHSAVASAFRFISRTWRLSCPNLMATLGFIQTQCLARVFDVLESAGLSAPSRKTSFLSPARVCQLPLSIFLASSCHLATWALPSLLVHDQDGCPPKHSRGLR